jgi:hypothetical protein
MENNKETLFGVSSEIPLISPADKNYANYRNKKCPLAELSASTSFYYHYGNIIILLVLIMEFN